MSENRRVVMKDELDTKEGHHHWSIDCGYIDCAHRCGEEGNWNWGSKIKEG
jgi:hypothetical protein